MPDECIVSEYDVFKELTKIKLRISIGPDAVPHRILKDLADVLAAPITSITNPTMPKLFRQLRQPKGVKLAPTISRVLG